MHGPASIDGVAIVVRPPLLGDGPSWRETCKTYVGRLRAAFARDGMDWDAAHSPLMWIDTLHRSRAENETGVSSFIVRVDEGKQRVVGHVAITGVHPRTGAAEASIWVVGVTPPVTRWAVACLALELFERDDAPPHLVVPVAVGNPGPRGMAMSLGLTCLQTQRQLREYDGVIADHNIWILMNTPEAHARLAEVVAEAPNGLACAVPPRSVSSAVRDAVTVPRYGARLLRQALRRSRMTPPEPGESISVVSADGEHIVFAPTPGDAEHYRVSVDDREVGVLRLAVDTGSSTTELLPRLSPELSRKTNAAVIAALARHVAEVDSATRRTVVVIPADDRDLSGALSDVGFFDEGSAPPSPGEQLGEQQMWTRLRPSEQDQLLG